MNGITSLGHIAINVIELEKSLLQALIEMGIDYKPAFLADPQGHSVMRGFWAMDMLMSLPNRTTAVFAANGSLAIGALRLPQKNRVRVPQDVAIVGFDNMEFAEHAPAPDGLPEPRVTMIDLELIVRDSTAGTGD